MTDKKHKAGSHIALRSLASEIEAITGERMDVTQTETRNTSSALTEGMGGFNFSGFAVLCIDCSYSMEGKDFIEAKHGAVKFCREALELGYSVGLVGFSSEAWAIGDITNNLSNLKSSIDRLEIKGLTNMADAIRVARGLLVEYGKSKGTICILTDGIPDDVDSDTNKAPDTEREAEITKSLEIEIMCLGIEGAYMPVLDRIASTKELSEQCSRNDIGNRLGMMTKHLKIENKK